MKETCLWDRWNPLEGQVCKVDSCTPRQRGLGDGEYIKLKEAGEEFCTVLVNEILPAVAVVTGNVTAGVIGLRLAKLERRTTSGVGALKLHGPATADRVPGKSRWDIKA